MLNPIPDGVPDEVRLVLLCRKVRRLQRKHAVPIGYADTLVTLERELDLMLAEYDSDAKLRQIRY